MGFERIILAVNSMFLMNSKIKLIILFPFALIWIGLYVVLCLALLYALWPNWFWHLYVVEQRKQPTLRGHPTAVVQYNSWKGGGLIAVSYEARKFGVKRWILNAWFIWLFFQSFWTKDFNMHFWYKFYARWWGQGSLSTNSACPGPCRTW